MSGYYALGLLGTLVAGLLFVVVRQARRQGRQAEKAERREAAVEDYQNTVEAVLNEKVAADELAARERLLKRNTRKP